MVVDLNIGMASVAMEDFLSNLPADEYVS
jgi:hypothetical protein